MSDYKRQPQVTTRVTGGRAEEKEDDLDCIRPFPPNVITVQRNLVRDVVEITPERSDSEMSTNGGVRRTRSWSEDGFFGKC